MPLESVGGAAPKFPELRKKGALLGPPVRGRRKLITNPVQRDAFTVLGWPGRLFVIADPTAGSPPGWTYALGAWPGRGGFRFVQAGA